MTRSRGGICQLRTQQAGHRAQPFASLTRNNFQRRAGKQPVGGRVGRTPWPTVSFRISKTDIAKPRETPGDAVELARAPNVNRCHPFTERNYPFWAPTSMPRAELQMREERVVRGFQGKPAELDHIPASRARVRARDHIPPIGAMSVRAPCRFLGDRE